MGDDIKAINLVEKMDHEIKTYKCREIVANFFNKHSKLWLNFYKIKFYNIVYKILMFNVLYKIILFQSNNFPLFSNNFLFN